MKRPTIAVAGLAILLLIAAPRIFAQSDYGNPNMGQNSDDNSNQQAQPTPGADSDQQQASPDDQSGDDQQRATDSDDNDNDQSNSDNSDSSDSQDNNSDSGND